MSKPCRQASVVVLHSHPSLPVNFRCHVYHMAPNYCGLGYTPKISEK